MDTRPLTVKEIMKKLLWLLPAPLFYGLSLLAMRYPQVTETVYARGVFPFIVRPLSAITGVLPFSLAEILLYAAALMILYFVISTPVRAFLAGKAWWQMLVRRILAAAMTASVLYAAFIGLFGLCYARQPLGTTLGLDVRPSGARELYETTQALLDRANALRSEIKSKQGDMSSDLDRRREILSAVPGYYEQAAKRTGFEFLGGGYGPVKPVLYSTGLSYANIEGVYFPYTGEANINMKQPMLFFAASALHEAAHQRGFAREDEANYLAYYVGSNADDVEVRYSSTMLAVTYALSALASADNNYYSMLTAKMSADIKRDLNESDAFWKAYQGTVSEASARVNDGYLKANSQRDGIQSYGRMVDLLIGLYRQGGI